MDITEQLLRDAGIGAGMRVLDLGCGLGDVSFLAARLVGASGQVVGVDLNADALTTAAERARTSAQANVTFVHADLDTIELDAEPFDAVVGRRVLMYLPRPDRTLSQVSRLLRSGGVAAFQEHDGTVVQARAGAFPLHELVSRWIWTTVEREGGNLRMGFDLPSVFTQAGLTLQNLRAEAILMTRTKSSNLAWILRTMLGRITSHGVASAAEIDIETLEERLEAERLARDSAFITDLIFCGWARKP